MAVFEPEAEIATFDTEEVGGEVVGRSPWALAGRRFLRNKLAIAAAVLFVLIVAVSFAAPLYANYVADTDPFVSNLSGTFTQNGKTIEVIQQGTGKLGLGETPVGPTWHAKYLLGADSQGRDVAARVLYGGRASLEIGIGSAVLASLLAVVFALIAGFFGGWTDNLLSRLMDLIWAFPVYLLAISLATVLLTAPNGLKIGFLHVSPGSLWIPLVIIGVVYVPYIFRPVRGQVLSLREREFVEPAAGLQRDPAERCLDRDRAHAFDHCDHDPDRGSAFVPIDRSPGSAGELGNDRRGRTGVALHPTLGRDRARNHDRVDRSRPERSRRRPSRRARPALEAADEGLT